MSALNSWKLERKINPNAVRFGVLCALICGTMIITLLSSCKSRYGFTNQNKEGAETSRDGSPSRPDALPTDPVAPPARDGETPPSTNPGGSTDPNNQGSSTETPPATPGGPVAGIEAWQEGKLVTSIATGKSVQFKLTKWSRDTSATSGCDENRGLVQASWTIGSRTAVDLQRYAGQECRSFDYSGTFTRPGNIVVQLDVVTLDGEQAHASVTYPVTGDVINNSTPPAADNSGSTSTNNNPGQTPAQTPAQTPTKK